MTEIGFVKLSPTQNMTLLVTSRHPVEQYRSIAAQLLSAGHVHAEQVGFVHTSTSPHALVRLHMAGGEFCGNACMSLAALIAAGQDLDFGAGADIVLETSGALAPVSCRVERQHPGYYCTLTTPPPTQVEPHSFPGVEAGRSAVLRYRDSVHLVVECTRADQAMRDRAQEVAVHLAAREGVPLIGIMLYDPVHCELAPLINVPSLNSMTWERSCGSGTGSVGAYLAARSGGSIRTSVHQPGGTMQVEAHHGAEGVTGLRIGGQVHVVAEGTAYVHV